MHPAAIILAYVVVSSLGWRLVHNHYLRRDPSGPACSSPTCRTACFQEAGTDRACRVIEVTKKGGTQISHRSPKPTSGLPKGSPSQPERCLNANRQSDSFTSLEIASRNSNHIPGGTRRQRSPRTTRFVPWRNIVGEEINEQLRQANLPALNP